MTLGLSHNAALLCYTVVAIVGIIVLVARFKLHAFLALLLASLFVGVCAGTKPIEVAKAFQDGLGGTLSLIAVVIGLGTMLGKMLAESGGAEVIATTFIKVFGERRLHWAMMIVGFVVGLPVFFAVGLVLLMPILSTLVKETKKPLLLLGIPLVAGLSVSHTLVPPHPGAMLAITQLGADTGKTILWSIMVGVPTALIAGPLFGSIISRHVHAELGGLAANLATPARRAKPPSFAMALATILLPVALMLAATLATIKLEAENPIRLWAEFIGSPAVAMLVAVLFSFFSFGWRCGFDREEILRFTEESVAPAASIILVVGAGGGFSKVLDASEVDQAIVALVSGRNISLLLLGWTLAALIRIAVGSATVAISLAASLMAQMLKTNPAVDRELLVVAVGAGSLILSHVNDGGFWFVKEYFNMSVAQTFNTWTVMETIASVTALILVLALNALM